MALSASSSIGWGIDMFRDIYYLTALITSFLCLLVIGLAIVRLSKPENHHLKARIKYTGQVLIAVVACLQPYYAANYPGIGGMALALYVVVLLVDGVAPLKEMKKPTFQDTNIYYGFDEDEK